MQPIFSIMNTWSCIVISAFAIVILSVIGALFQASHHSMVDNTKDPDNGPAVAATVFTAVAVYAGFLVFCGFQAFLHYRESRRGAITL